MAEAPRASLLRGHLLHHDGEGLQAVVDTCVNRFRDGTPRTEGRTDDLQQARSSPSRLCWRFIHPDCSPAGGPIRRARLVREYDRLHAVAEVELLKNVGDVSLDGGLADVELLPDLCVREATSHQAKDVSLALTELVKLLRRSRP